MIKVCVRWFDSYYEEFDCVEVRTGNYYLWLRLTNGQNRYIPLHQVRWYSQNPESHSKQKASDKNEGVAESMSKKNCPICDYPFDMCQCRFGGTAHPDRSIKARVVTDHIYLLSDEQIEHLKKVQEWWHVVYTDKEKQQILTELERGDN